MSEAQLDSEELLFLAIRDSEEGKHDDSITKLKSALRIDADNAKAQYMLAAQYAEIGMYERALEHMQASVQLDPDLHTAHFQLGLLHLTAGRLVEADLAWRPLDALGDDSEFFLFKSGLLVLANDEGQKCIEFIERGLEANVSNPALNKDMERVVEDVKKQLSQVPGGAAEELPQSNVLLNSYQQDD